MKKKELLLCCLLSLFTAIFYAQDITEISEAPLAETREDDGEESLSDGSLSRERQRIEMEIRTSTLPELAAWCRSLGLSEGGTRAELSTRLRVYYQLPDATPSAQRQITIESAQTTEYFKIEVTDEEYARLTGNVGLVLIENDVVHRIRAQEIIFNRTRNILTARGQVVYEKESGETIETFRGENITVNIDDWSSVFLGGDSERMIDSDGTSYLFSGLVISRTSEDVTILNKARITNAKNEYALWSITASKLWLLPGSDFAFFNAILRVGEIPVMYLPFFYYPVDEIIFHPVIGYRPREGGFVQTTTYILGRPKADSSEESSITRILGDSASMEKEQHGMFLRNTGRRRINPQETSLKALFDYYVNMGTYIGLDLSTPRKGIFEPLDFSLGVGITRTLTRTGIGYTPYAPDYDGSSDWNHSNLLSREVPFRYRMNLQGGVSAANNRFASISWSLPYYSDPYVDKDFLDRSENMDWFKMIQQGTEADLKTTENGIGNYEWDLRGRLNMPPTALNPYISRINISNLSTTMSFKTFKNNKIPSSSEAPDRDFYAPDKFTIYSISGSLAGNPLTIGGQNTRSSGSTSVNIDDLFKGIGKPVSPWDENDDDEQDTASGERLVPPVLSQRFDIPALGNYTFGIDFEISPTGASELQFMNGNWQSYDQADWNEVQSILTSLGANGNINFRVDHSTRIFSNVVTLSGRNIWSDYTYLNEEADIFLDSAGNVVPERIENMRSQQYRQTNYTTYYENNSTLRPFFRDPVFGQSNLHYTFRGTLVKSKNYVQGKDGPELAPQWGSLVKEKLSDDIPGLNAHRLSSNMEANIMDYRQNISIGFDLPPLDGLISTNAAFRFWISETKMDFRMRKPEEENEWKYEPFNFEEILKFADAGSFTYYMVLTPEEDNDITTITSSLIYKGLTASFKALKTYKYEFIPVDPLNLNLGGSWEQHGQPELIPSELSIGYKRDFRDVQIIRNRLSFSMDIDTTLAYDLIRYTNSYFRFQMAFTLGINGFMDLRLTATSENNVIFRYFKNFPGMGNMTSMYMDGPQNNVFVDLFDSFNFLDESKRKRTGFKLRDFEIKAIHYLGDWRAELGVKMYPYMNTSYVIPKYEVTADVNFLVQWRPITEIKTDLRYEGELNRWTRR
ncbi:MAG: LPS-assembly protein LptD [Treponema sp.]|jgi:hypothetical protein|nr:LPS-assembly protein LptD [Treponema sp.]